MNWPRWNRSEEERLLDTHVPVFSQHHQTLIPLQGPSSSIHSTHPLLLHSDLHQCTARERKREGGTGKRMDEVFWEEQDEVWSLTPFGNRHRSSEVSFKVFSSIYGLHVCRSAFGMKRDNARGRLWMMSGNMNNSVEIHRFPDWLRTVFLLLYMCTILFYSDVWFYLPKWIPYPKIRILMQTENRHENAWSETCLAIINNNNA